MGRLAGTLLAMEKPVGASTLNVASDVLTPEGIAAAFAAAQGTPCVHKRARALRLLARFFLPDLFEVIEFYRTSTETTDIEELAQRFPDLLTTFADFLEETEWSNKERTYDDLATI